MANDKAELAVVAVVPEVGTDDIRLSQSIKRLQAALVDERVKQLDDLIRDATPANTAVEVGRQVISGDKDFIAIIKLVIDGRFDLLIKAVDRASAISAVLFGNHDLRLMRQCPCPVWLIKPARRKRFDTVLAAVDLTNDDPSASHLADRIVEIAAAVARREESELNVIAAWDQPIDPALRTHMESKAYEQLVGNHKTKIKQKFAALLRKHPGQNIIDHLIRGKPEAAITRFVKDYDVDLLVMGTLSRSGIPGLLIGNTAERVLSVVDCSVLTLKPKGFKTVIKP